MTKCRNTRPTAGVLCFCRNATAAMKSGSPTPLKVVKVGMDTAQVLARFNNERQALAMMDHLNIAQIFDGGATAKGRPYFVMEYIEGAPITRTAIASG